MAKPPETWTLEKVRKRIRRNAREAVKSASVVLQRQIKRELSRRGPGKPSPPGTPPALQTGQLRQSVQIDFSGLSDRKKPHALVGPGAFYGKYHEFGTKMHPKRQFVGPGEKKVEGRLKRILSAKSILKGIKRR